MKQKQGLDLAAVILLLLIACAALAVPVALLSPQRGAYCGISAAGCAPLWPKTFAVRTLRTAASSTA